MRFVLILLLALSVSGATYKGKNIDGKKYACTVKGHGFLIAGSCRFDGRTAHLSDGKYEIDVRLDSEAIDDPQDIEAGDWTISITDGLE